MKYLIDILIYFVILLFFLKNLTIVRVLLKTVGIIFKFVTMN